MISTGFLNRLLQALKLYRELDEGFHSPQQLTLLLLQCLYTHNPWPVRAQTEAPSVCVCVCVQAFIHMSW